MHSAAAASSGLHVSARTEDRVTIAELAGELDVASVPELREQLLALLRPASGRLVVNLSRVTFCDASGLAVLVGTGRRARILGGFLRLAAVPPEVSRILRSTGLDRHLLAFATVSAAAGAPDDPSGRAGGAVQTPRPVRSWPAHPLSYSPVAETATRLRRVLGPRIRPAVGRPSLRGYREAASSGG